MVLLSPAEGCDTLWVEHVMIQFRLLYEIQSTFDMKSPVKELKDSRDTVTIASTYITYSHIQSSSNSQSLKHGRVEPLNQGIITRVEESFKLTIDGSPF